MIQEYKQSFAVLEHPLLVLLCDLRLESLRRDVGKETSHLILVLSEVVLLEAELIYRVNDSGTTWRRRPAAGRSFRSKGWYRAAIDGMT